MKFRRLLLVACVCLPLASFAQPGARGDRPGPWDHDVLAYRVARDGTIQKIATFERAGVPTATRLQDGRILAAFQHFPDNDPANFDRVAVCFSTNGGNTWSAPQPIVVQDMDPGLERPFDPTLVTLPDGRVRLYFTSKRSRDLRLGNPAIYSGVSSDGIHYRFEPGVRFAVEGKIVIDCSVALHKGTFHLIVPINGSVSDRVGQGQRPEGKGYHATSTNGLDFTRIADVVSAPENRWLGNLICRGDQLAFFGTGPGPWPATSADGSHWTPSHAAVRIPGADPAAVDLHNGDTLLLATGGPRPDTPSAVSRTPFNAPSNQRGKRPAFRADGAATGFSGALPADGPFRRGPNRNETAMRAGDFENIFVRIPSSAAGELGIAASLTIPKKGRYTNGAPVVINVPGGHQPGIAFGRPEYVRLGFVEMHFAFPGGGTGSERSGGTYDLRGPNCARALADVIRFALGRIADERGRRIQEIANGISVLTNNVGIVGSSHGGNTCGVVMARHGGEFPSLAWYASMESPYGQGAANVELGGHQSGLNPAYDPDSGKLDCSMLAWAEDLQPGMSGWPTSGSAGQLAGAMFFDLNQDGRFSRDKDFPANCLVGDAGSGVKAWYSPRLLEAAEARQIIPTPRPSHIPSCDDAREFWHWRDALQSIQDAVRNCPNLAVIVYANERDHVQEDPRHTHILEQLEAFRKAKARFVRMNPDRAYVRSVLPEPQASRQDNFADNPAGKEWSRKNITCGLEPHTLSIPFYMQAAAAELADRTQFNTWSADLDQVLTAQ